MNQNDDNDRSEDRRDRITAAEINTQLEELFPSAWRDGFRCETLAKHSATARWIFDEEALRPGRYIPGPTLFSAADIALWFGVFNEIGLEPMAVTSELSIRFLRPAQGGDVLAEATIESVGRRRIVGSVRLWIEGNPDRPVAVAQGAYARP